MRTATARSVRVSVSEDDFIKIERNDLRSIAHSEPTVSARTVAARGLPYMRASSPKQGLMPPPVVYLIKEAIKRDSKALKRQSALSRDQSRSAIKRT